VTPQTTNQQQTREPFGAPRLVAYLRQSVSNGGDSLEAQEAAIRSWAEAHGYEIVDVFADDGLSGPLDEHDRPGLAAALKALEDGEASGVVVHRLDRLARLLTTQEALLAAIWSRAGRIFAVDGGEILRDDPDDPMRRAMRQMAGVFAELERAMIVRRMQAGRKLARERGRTAGGSRPYGYRILADKRLEPVPEEQAVIRRVLKLREEGRTLRAIGAEVGLHPERVRQIVRREGTRAARRPRELALRRGR
jgi:DNA invertase Pin-like site-specific DNA recombinase